jgi:alcohol dehydrogenase class IV
MTGHEGTETVFTYGAPPLKMGPGAADEIGADLAAQGVRRALLLTDPGVAAAGAPSRIAGTARAAGVDVVVWPGVRVEPTDASIREAVAHARAESPWDAVVAVGGGSAIDTAKAVDLLLTNEGDLEEYLNPPIGAGRAPRHPLLPLVAVPTTTGTGAESTAVCVLDVLDLRVKTGISHPRLRPSLAVVDPLLTLTLPAAVTACSGMDILCHALESLTARPYTAFARKQPHERVPYCGANPIADLWAERALALLGRSFRRAVQVAGRAEDDLDTRTDMASAATFAGLGFGNAGVHIPHANAYPIAGRVRDFRPRGYPQDEPLVPHGMAVVLTAPAAFRFTFASAPERHLRAAELLAYGGAEPAGDPAERLPAAIVALMRALALPSGLEAVGYGRDDLPDLVQGALRQERLLAVAPRTVTPDDLERILEQSLAHW